MLQRKGVFIHHFRNPIDFCEQSRAAYRAKGDMVISASPEMRQSRQRGLWYSFYFVFKAAYFSAGYAH